MQNISEDPKNEIITIISVWESTWEAKCEVECMKNEKNNMIDMKNIKYSKGYSIWNPQGGGLENIHFFLHPPTHIFIFRLQSAPPLRIRNGIALILYGFIFFGLHYYYVVQQVEQNKTGQIRSLHQYNHSQVLNNVYYVFVVVWLWMM